MAISTRKSRASEELGAKVSTSLIHWASWWTPRSWGRGVSCALPLDTDNHQRYHVLHLPEIHGDLLHRTVLFWSQILGLWFRFSCWNQSFLTHVPNLERTSGSCLQIFSPCIPGHFTCLFASLASAKFTRSSTKSPPEEVSPSAPG